MWDTVLIIMFMPVWFIIGWAIGLWYKNRRG